MIRRPPRSTRTDTLFPYTTLVRISVAGRRVELRRDDADDAQVLPKCRNDLGRSVGATKKGPRWRPLFLVLQPAVAAYAACALRSAAIASSSARCILSNRSEERRVGIEGVRTCRSRGSPYH